MKSCSVERFSGKNIKTIFPSLVVTLFFLFFWQFLINSKVINEIYFGSPLGILQDLPRIFDDPEILTAMFTSLGSFLTSLLVAILIALPLGLVGGYNQVSRSVIGPIIHLLNSVPIIILMPMFIIWFGIGLDAKIIIIVLMSVPPIIINLMDSINNISKDLMMMAHSFKFTKMSLLKNLIFMNSLPALFSGLKIASGRALIGLVVAELFGIGGGVGYYISLYSSTFQINLLWSIVLMFILLNQFIIFILERIERHVVYWR